MFYSQITINKPLSNQFQRLEEISIKMAETDTIENGVGEEDYEALRVSGCAELTRIMCRRYLAYLFKRVSICCTVKTSKRSEVRRRCQWLTVINDTSNTRFLKYPQLLPILQIKRMFNLEQTWVCVSPVITYSRDDLNGVYLLAPSIPDPKKRMKKKMKKRKKNFPQQTKTAGRRTGVTQRRRERRRWRRCSGRS